MSTTTASASISKITKMLLGCHSRTDTTISTVCSQLSERLRGRVTEHLRSFDQKRMASAKAATSRPTSRKEVYARVHPLLLLPLIDYVRCRANFYNIILLIRLDLSSKLLLYTFALHSHLLAPTLFRFLSRICKNLLFKHLQIKSPPNYSSML